MEQKLKKLPIGIQDFEKARTKDCLYVDKTAILYELVSQGDYFFLSRPRRFGKSMFLSTLKAYFLGKKELFRGLAIENIEKDWIEYPVLHLDLNTSKYVDKGTLDNKLDTALKEWEVIYGRRDDNPDFGVRFEGVIRRAKEKTGRNVVILVDEYDKPMLQAIGNKELQDDYRATLKGFYGALKSMDGCIKFAMLTGVTKFGKVSVFSDLNNLRDISLIKQFYDICGMSEEELHANLDDYVKELAEYQGVSKEEAYEKLKIQYDGYHFAADAPGMYNPFSVLNALASQDFGSYWFETGTPSYLVELLQKHDYNLEEMAAVETDEDSLNSVDILSTNPIPVIFQSGYLTIKGYDKEFGLYRLGFPNAEVERGFVRYLMPYYTSVREGSTGFEIMNFVKDVRAGNVDGFMKRLKSFFADTPYELIKNLENHYQNVLFIVSRLCGFYTKAEYHTSEGRIDMTLETDKYIYVFEFKLDGTAEEALKQIADKDYPLPFAVSGKQVVCIGANFSGESRNIERYCVRIDN